MEIMYELLEFQFPFFKKIKRQFMKKENIITALKHFEIKHFLKSEKITTYDSKPKNLYFILQGKADILVPEITKEKMTIKDFHKFIQKLFFFNDKLAKFKTTLDLNFEVLKETKLKLFGEEKINQKKISTKYKIKLNSFASKIKAKNKQKKKTKFDKKFFKKIDNNLENEEEKKENVEKITIKEKKPKMDLLITKPGSKKDIVRKSLFKSFEKNFFQQSEKDSPQIKQKKSFLEIKPPAKRRKTSFNSKKYTVKKPPQSRKGSFNPNNVEKKTFSKNKL